ncbi:uncharacterized protein TNCV_63551 [Trichonephila clavipes]|nr:uncharacterized protein TNCV_63551 [Trichonephila clavipes]
MALEEEIQSKRLRLGKREGQATGLPSPIHPSGKVTWRSYCTAVGKCPGALLYMNNTFCCAVAGNRDYTGMWVRRGSTSLMAGNDVFLRGLLSPIRVVDLTLESEYDYMLAIGSAKGAAEEKDKRESPDNAHSVAFSQRSSSPHLVEDETFNDNDIINNSMDYEDGHEEPDSLRADKNMQESSFPTNWKSIFLK